MIEELKAEIEKLRNRHYRGQRWWSVAHHATTAGAAFLSLVVIAISQAKEWTPPNVSRDSLIAIVALLAATLAAFASKGSYERKWIANRMTRSKLDALRLDLLDDHVDPVSIKDSLKRIIAEHDAAITGSKP